MSRTINTTEWLNLISTKNQRLDIGLLKCSLQFYIQFLKLNWRYWRWEAGTPWLTQSQLLRLSAGLARNTSQSCVTVVRAMHCTELHARYYMIVSASSHAVISMHPLSGSRLIIWVTVYEPFECQNWLNSEALCLVKLNKIVLVTQFRVFILISSTTPNQKGGGLLGLGQKVD